MSKQGLGAFLSDSFSLSRGLLIQTIEACGFQHQEFLLSPSSVGTTITDPYVIDHFRASPTGYLM